MLVFEVQVLVQGVPKKMRHLFPLISPSVLMLQFYTLYGQLIDVLPFVLHIGRGLRDKRFPRYSGSDYRILCKTVLKVNNTYISTRSTRVKIVTGVLSLELAIDFVSLAPRHLLPKLPLKAGEDGLHLVLLCHRLHQVSSLGWRKLQTNQNSEEKFKEKHGE